VTTTAWRTARANGLVSRDNPLTARVFVNRLWHQHFGQGIVATPSDFGTLGAAPTHPELLDWLALQLSEGKWSIKGVQRLILKSNAYRQTSLREDARAQEIDTTNSLL